MCVYVQVEAKAATFGWRSNNIGEIGQGKYLDFTRNSHPLDLVSELLQKTHSIINEIAEKNAIWRLQDQGLLTDSPRGQIIFRKKW